MKILLRSALLSSLVLAACEKQAPPPIAPPVKAEVAGELPSGHPPIGEMPSDHPPVGQMPADHPPIGEGGQGTGGGHPPVGGGMTSAELLKQVEEVKAQIGDKPKSFEIAAALGNLYYENGRFGDASVHFGEALQKAAGLLALREDLAKKPVAPVSLAAAGCDDVREVEPLTAKAQAHLKAGRRAEAQACADAAAKPLVPVLARRANGYFLIGRVDDALGEHAKALSIDPDALESLFFTGAMLYDTHGDELPQLERARTAWKRFVEVAPKDHPRWEIVARMLPELEQAIAVGGASKLPHLAAAPPAGTMPPNHPPVPGMGMPPNHPPMGRGDAVAPPISPEVMQAIENTPRGPELDAALDESIVAGEEALAKNDGDEASNHYRSVLAFQPNNARVQAGMAAAQILKGSAMAQRVLSVAVGTDPQAVDALADRLRAKGNAELAKTLWTRLKELAPAYAAQANLDAKIAK